MIFIKSIIFDMDGVIFDSEKVALEAWSAVRPKYGIEDIYPHYLRCVGCNHRWAIQVFKKAFGENFPANEYLLESRERYINMVKTGGLPLKPGIKELLEYLKGRGYKIALASSTDREIVTAELKTAGLLDYFDALMCGDMVKKSKPHPEIFLTACRLLGGLPGQAIVVEDSYNGIRAAHSGGFFPVMVPDMLPPTREMREKARLILPNLRALQDWLRENR